MADSIIKYGDGYGAIVLGDQQHAAAADLLREHVGHAFAVLVATGPVTFDYRIRSVTSVPFDSAIIEAAGGSCRRTAGDVLREFARSLVEEADRIEADR